MTLKRPEQTYVRNATDLASLWSELMGPYGFDRRSLWIIFLARDGQLHPTVVPIDDLPADPDPQLVSNIAAVLRETVADDDGPDGHAALLLSRPGPGQMSGGDRAWARALTAAIDSAVCPWPIHLATAAGVRPFAPDDLCAA